MRVHLQKVRSLQNTNCQTWLTPSAACGKVLSYREASYRLPRRLAGEAVTMATPLAASIPIPQLKTTALVNSNRVGKNGVLTPAQQLQEANLLPELSGQMKVTANVEAGAGLGLPEGRHT